MIPTESISELNIRSNLNRKSVCENTDKIVLKLEFRYIAIMSGITVTQALCSNFSVRSNGGLLKQYKTLEWTPYLAGVTAAVLHPHLPKLQSILKWELYCIYNGNPYIWKDSFLHWDRALSDAVDGCMGESMTLNLYQICPPNAAVHTILVIRNGGHSRPLFEGALTISMSYKYHIFNECKGKIFQGHG